MIFPPDRSLARPEDGVALPDGRNRLPFDWRRDVDELGLLLDAFCEHLRAHSA